MSIRLTGKVTEYQKRPQIVLDAKAVLPFSSPSRVAVTLGPFEEAMPSMG